MTLADALQQADVAFYESAADALAACEATVRCRGGSDEEVGLEVDRLSSELKLQHFRVRQHVRAIFLTGHQVQ